jgi:hypothetical protein
MADEARKSQSMNLAGGAATAARCAGCLLLLLLPIHRGLAWTYRSTVSRRRSDDGDEAAGVVPVRLIELPGRIDRDSAVGAGTDGVARQRAAGGAFGDRAAQSKGPAVLGTDQLAEARAGATRG